MRHIKEKILLTLGIVATASVIGAGVSFASFRAGAYKVPEAPIQAEIQMEHADEVENLSQVEAPTPSITPVKKKSTPTPQPTQSTTPQVQNTFAPCTVEYPHAGYSKTYNGMSPEDCKYWQGEAKKSTGYTFPAFSIAPYPSIAPYQPSQEYQNSLNQNTQNINSSYAPSPFVAPSPKCNPVGDGFNCF